jgi:hypothetical protein
MTECIEMLKRKEKSLTMLCVLLSFIVVSPSFLSIPLLQTGPTLLSVETRSSTEWVAPTLGGFRETKRVDRYVRIEKWTNGTKKHCASHIYLNVPECWEMWANYTGWLPENLTAQQTSQSQTASLQPLTEGNLPKEPKDGNIVFIYGRNSTCYTTYEHDDNYEMYYPLLWDTPFALQGLTKTHVHLAKSLLAGWISGNISEMIFLGVTLLTYEAINALSGDLIELITKGGDAIRDKILTSILDWLVVSIGCPEIAAFWGLWGWVEAFLECLKPLEKAVWVASVVEELFGGDGWTWHGPYYDVAEVIEVGYFPFDTKPGSVWNVSYVKGVQATWGKDTIFGTPGEYIVLWNDHREIFSYPPNIRYRPEDYACGPW